MSRCLLLCLFFAGLALPGTAGPRPAPAAPAVTEITLERTPCFGTCPVDKVTLRADGTATYSGTRFVDRMGEYQGSFPRQEFDKLAAFMAAQGFFNLKDRYAVPATDLPSRIAGAVRNGTRKSVTDYGGAGPDNLWAVQRAILGVAAEIRFKKTGDTGKPAPPR